MRTYKDFLGRGPTRATAGWLLDGRVACSLRDVLTRSERILLESGHAQLVIEARKAMHASMVDALAAAARTATGREVTDVALDFNPSANTAVEVFTVDDAVGTAVAAR